MIRLLNKTRAKTKVTVGLCVKNSGKTVKGAINSVINQTYPSELVEIIVVDGGSKDETLSVVTDMASNTNTRVEIHFDEGRGLGAARQMVVDNANGNYVIFVDGDVELVNDFVQKQVDFMEKNPRVGIAVGKYLYKEGTLIASLQNLHHYITEFLGNDATIYRTKALRQVGGFDINIKGACEDLDMMAKLRVRGWELSINKKAKFYHSPRETWRAFWIEQKWFGYGGHYFVHKHKHMNTPFPLWYKVPSVTFVATLKVAVKAYRLLHKKESFLMPLLFSLGTISWWLGFAKSNLDGYGHEAN